MKKLLLSAAALCYAMGSALASHDHTSPNPNGFNRCSSMEVLERLKKEDPTLEGRMEKIEEETQAWITKNAKNPKPFALVKIPTVVHVVYANSTQNVSDALVQGQINALNKDYRKTNADASNIPSAFASIAADCEIEFCLAAKDPNGANTNGIIRKQTSVASWTTDDKVKYTAQGGSDAWPAAQYCNLWLCNLGSGLLGYAQFPGGSAATDGIVVLYSSIPGGSAAPYNLGRTATHEVGHWLNLRHIWGDANCGNDQVTDTPTAEGPHYSVNGSGPPTGCPTHPYHTNQCSGGSPQGENWQNYMDYTDDKCMFMFTAGQKARMQACLAGSRSGLGPAAATKCGTTGINDVLAADMISIYPNPSTGEVTIGTELMNINTMDLVIYNALGEAVVTRKVQVPASKETKVDLSNNPDGIYLFEMKTPEGTITKKVVINR